MKIVEEPRGSYQAANTEIIKAVYKSEHKIQVYFHDGNKKTVDFHSFLAKSNHPSIKKYLDFNLFKTFQIVDGNLNWNDYDLIFLLADLYKGHIS